MLTPAAPRGDAGTTLAELVVGMALTVLVGAMALGFFVWTGRSSSATGVNTFTAQNARTAMTTTTGLLRLAVPGSVVPGAVSGQVSTSVSFSALDNVVAGCVRRPAASMTMTVAGGTLVLARTGPVSTPTPAAPCGYTAAVSSSRVLATNVLAGSGFAFTYQPVNGNASTDPTRIGTVSVTLVVADPAGRTQNYAGTALVSGVPS